MLALDLLAEVDRLRAENDAWRSYAKWSCTRDDRTYPCGDCDGCRSWRGRPWEHFQHEVETEAARYHEHACIYQQQRDTLRARIDAARALCEPSEWSVLDPRRERLLRALNGEGATDE